MDRKEALEVLKYLNQPMAGTQVKELRKIHKEFQKNTIPKNLIGKISKMREKYGMTSPETASAERLELAREDLKLICFDFLCS